MGLLSFLFGCSSKGPYQQKDGVWYYKDRVVGSGTAAGFTPIDGLYARDAERGYYRESPVAESHGPTFVVLSEHYAKDRARAFYNDTYRKGQEYWLIRRNRSQVIDGADVASFAYLDQDYARDARRIYFEGAPFAVKDPASFEVLHYGFTRDKATGYWHQTPVDGSDGATFTPLDDRYSKDASHVFFSWIPPVRDNVRPTPASRRIDGADPATFRAIELGYARDATRAYHDGAAIATGIASFDVLSLGYAKSDRAVFYDGKVVPGADAATFVMLDTIEDDADARDRTATYRSGKRTKP